MALNKTELVAKIAAATGQSQASVNTVLEGLFETILAAVAKGDKVSIPGWLSFDTVETAARTGRNPQTGEAIKIPAGKRVKISAGSKLKAAVKPAAKKPAAKKPAAKPAAKKAPAKKK